jgi:hypothetical protein
VNAATASEWLTAAAIGTALYLPIVAAVLAAGTDLPHMPAGGPREVTDRARTVLALAQRLETGEASR